MTPARTLSFLVPGDWFAPTGGFRYDRCIAQALVAAGWTVHALRLDGDWPSPDDATLARAAAGVAGIADGTTVLADGLAFGVLGSVVAAHASRLRWVALVHHPLHLETGLAEPVRQRLLARETHALSFARRVVVTSARTARDVAAMGVPTARIAVVEPGTDTGPPEAGAPAGAGGGAARHPGAPVRLLCVATVTPRKGHVLLLQALAGLRGLPWELHCVGSLTRDPVAAARVRDTAERLGLAPRITWHGEVDHPALHAHYAGADLLVLASLHEGYGMVVAEALAAGLPVVSTDAGALAQTLPAAAGMHVPAGDAAALQAALEQLIGDPAWRRRLAAGARAAAAKLPRWPGQAARLATVLEAVA